MKTLNEQFQDSNPFLYNWTVTQHISYFDEYYNAIITATNGEYEIITKINFAKHLEDRENASVTLRHISTNKSEKLEDQENVPAIFFDYTV